MDFWGGYVFPDVVVMMMDLLDPTGDGTFGGARAYPSRPIQWDPATDKAIVVAAAGGSQNAEGDTLNAIVMIQSYAPTYTQASNQAQWVQKQIESCPGTEIGPDRLLADEAELWSAPTEVPDDYPDDRRITTHYRVAVRRQVLIP
jgi:hypothetical protein